MPIFTSYAFLATGGTATRTTPARAADMVNVKEFGAVGNSVDDDTVAIQAALDSGAHTVWLPDGGYNISATLTIPTGVCLRGSSKATSIIRLTASLTTAVSQIYGVVTVSGSSIQDLNIAAVAGTVTVTGAAVTLAREFDFINVLFTGFTTSVTVDRGRFVKLINVTSRGTASKKAGNVVLRSSSDASYLFETTVEGLFFDNIGNGVNDGGFSALYMRRCVTAHIHNVNMNDIVTGGAIVGIIIENDCQGVKVSQVSMAGPTTGVLLRQGAGVAIKPSFTTLSDIDIDQPSTNALTITDGNLTIIKGGNITCSGAVPTIKAVLIGAAAAWTTIVGQIVNGFNGAGGSAYSISAGSSNTNITGGIVQDCTSVLTVGGATTRLVVANNIWTTFTTAVSGAVSGTGNIINSSGTGSPEGVMTAPVGSLFQRTDSATSLYVKQTLTGNTGWVAK